MTRRTFLSRLSAAVMGVVAAVYVPSMPWKSEPESYPRDRGYALLSTVWNPQRGVLETFIDGRLVSANELPQAPWYVSRVSDPAVW